MTPEREKLIRDTFARNWSWKYNKNNIPYPVMRVPIFHLVAGFVGDYNPSHETIFSALEFRYETRVMYQDKTRYEQFRITCEGIVLQDWN